MQQSGETWQRLTDFAVQIHCKNPSPYTLCGTNCFVIGRGPIKTLVDPGDFPERNQEFLANFGDYLQQNDGVKFNRILVTHGHADHFGGVFDTIKLLEQTNRVAGDLMTYKYLTDNSCERDVFEKYPSLRDSVRSIDNNQLF